MTHRLVMVAAACLCAGAAQATEHGVYTGPANLGVTGQQVYNAWLGRKADRALEFCAFDSWASLVSSCGWASYQWQKAGQRRITFSIPLTVSGTPLTAVTAGSGDSYFRTLFSDLIKNGFGHQDIRLGWEMNGGWYPWGNIGGREADFAAAFRHVHDVAMALPGAHFTWTWCVTFGWAQTIRYDDFYPGSQYVDYVGMDVYATDWGVNNPSDGAVWTAINQNYSLEWLPKMGTHFQKPISLPEWGVGDRPVGSSNYGPGDSAVVMADMLAWIATHGVRMANYWDFNAGDYNSRISMGERPQEAAAYKHYFTGH